MADSAQDAARSFDAYDVIGVITPGAVLALLLTFEWPPLHAILGDKDLSIGDFGLFLIVAFVLGHLLQAVGNLVEWVIWVIPGMPTTWPRSASQRLISPAQRDALQSKVSAMEGGSIEIANVDRRRWGSITRRAYGRVAAAGRATLVDAHNRTYGMCRGLAAALVIALGWVLFEHRQDFQLIAIIGFALASVVWRMWRMGINYGRALLLAFIDLE